MPRERDEKKSQNRFGFRQLFIKKTYLFLEYSCLGIKPFSHFFFFVFPGLTNETYAVSGVLGRILVLYARGVALLTKKCKKNLQKECT